MEDKKNNFQNGNVLLAWDYPEFVKYKRSKRWYIIALAVVALVLVYSVFSYNFLLAVIAIMAVMVFLMRERSMPRSIKFIIFDTGIEIAGAFFQYGQIKNFSIVYSPPEVKVLYLEFSSKIKPRYTIYLEDADPNKVREVLNEYLEEDLNRKGESFSDAIGRWLKI